MGGNLTIKGVHKMRTRSIYNNMFEEIILMDAYRGSISHNLEVREKGKKFITDDVDTIKIYRYPEQYYLTLEGYNRNREVYEKVDGEIDIVAYEIRKAFHLLSELNPNITPILFLKDEHYIQKSEEFNFILDNKQIFYSKNRLRDVYIGYAKQQYKKMLNKGAYFGYQGNKRRELYEKLGYDAKHAQHAIRLLRVGIEWLRNGEPQIYRTDDRDELLSIKMGEFKLEDIKKMYLELLKEIDEACMSSKLPEKNNKYKINKLLYQVMTW
jgi:uncharacterized protein